MTTTAVAALGALFLLAAGASSALAAQTPAANAPAPSGQSPQNTANSKDHDPNEVICKSVEVSGSHLGGKRTCRTREAWEEMTRNGREQADSIRMQGLQSAPH